MITSGQYANLVGFFAPGARVSSRNDLLGAITEYMPDQRGKILLLSYLFHPPQQFPLIESMDLL